MFCDSFTNFLDELLRSDTYKEQSLFRLIISGNTSTSTLLCNHGISVSGRLRRVKTRMQMD